MDNKEIISVSEESVRVAVSDQLSAIHLWFFVDGLQFIDGWRAFRL
ncbi:MAG: hypothetical protein KF746_25860 [Chitinophagaceae bacterium]|nr:hypothetical protein [Chitinophagaceae bacterium]